MNNLTVLTERLINLNTRVFKVSRLGTNFSWYLMGNSFYAGCQWGMLILLAKLGTPTTVGLFSLALAVSAPIMMFASLKLQLVLATDAKQAYRFGDYLGLRLITTILAVGLVIIIVLAGRYGQEAAMVILVIGIAKAFESISDIFYGLQLQKEQMDRIAKSMIIKGGLSLIILGLAVYLTGSLFWGSVGLAVTWALVLMTYDVKSAIVVMKRYPDASTGVVQSRNLAKPIKPIWDLKVLSRLAWATLPLGFAVLLNSLLFNIPRYFIEGHIDAYSLGIFAALAAFGRIMGLFMHALGNAVSPRLATHYAAKDARAFTNLLAKMCGFFLLFGILVLFVSFVAGKQILSFFYKPEYAKVDIFIVLMLAAILGYLSELIVCAITAANRFRVQMFVYLVVTIALILLCVWLVPTHGIMGAAEAFAYARCIELAGVSLIVAFVFRDLYRSAKRPMVVSQSEVRRDGIGTLDNYWNH